MNFGKTSIIILSSVTLFFLAAFSGFLIVFTGHPCRNASSPLFVSFLKNGAFGVFIFALIGFIMYIILVRLMRKLAFKITCIVLGSWMFLIVVVKCFEFPHALKVREKCIAERQAIENLFNPEMK